MIRRRRSGGLTDQLSALAQAAELAHDRLDPELVATARHVGIKANERLRHGTANTLVALLGATGTGKSSITNALVGSDVALAGVRRPTTSSTLASYWPADPEPAADGASSTGEAATGEVATGEVDGLLDWLEVKSRHQVDEAGSELAGLVLLDLPDHDSVTVEHRLEMERMAEHTDLMVWITDPEKYADKAMHDYLHQLGEHGAITAMVLNKADLLSETDRKRCVSDLERLLATAGLAGSPVITVSATTGEGIDRLRSLLVDTVSAQQAVVDRLAADARTVATDLLVDLGPKTGADKVPDKVGRQLASELVEASGLSTVCDAVAAGHRRDAAGRIGSPFTRWARQLRPHPLRRLHLGRGSGGRASLPEASGVQRARSDNAVRQAAASVTADLPEPWPELVTEAATPDQAELNRRIDYAIAESVRAVNTGRSPGWWSAVNLVQIVLAVAAIVGAVWLGLLALSAYLRLPDIPTPTDPWIEFPIPTDLLIGGLIAGFIVSGLARQAARVGGARRAAAVRRDAEDAVRAISDEMVIEPMRTELQSRGELRSLLEQAGASR